MQADLAKINFYFPELPRQVRNKQDLVRLIMEIMRKDGNIKYAGYLKEKDLRNNLLKHVGSKNITKYKPPSKN